MKIWEGKVRYKMENGEGEIGREGYHDGPSPPGTQLLAYEGCKHRGDSSLDGRGRPHQFGD